MAVHPRPETVYPAATRLDLVDTLHGHQVPDPYRWLEDADNPDTRRWSTAQDTLTRGWLDSLPGREELSAELAALLRAGSISAPAWRGGRAFYTRRLPDQEHSVLHVREADGTERILLDVMAIDPTGTTTLDTWSPSREGERLAYQISVGGNEESLLHIIDVSTGELLDGPIDRCRYSSVAWLPGGEEICYVRRLAPNLVPEGEEQFHRRVYRHRISPLTEGVDAGADDVEILGDGLDPTNYYGVRLSTDGRWLVIDASPGTAPKDTVWLADLAGEETPRRVVDGDEGIRVSAWVERDGRLYVLTTREASRWRLCVADPTRPDDWTELIAEDPESVLSGIRYLPGGEDEPDRLVAIRTRHAVSELRLHELDGSFVNAIPLPGTGSLTGVSTVDSLTTHGAGRVWIGWTDFVTPASVYRHTTSTNRTELVEAAPGEVDIPAVNTAQHEFTSADGTTVRMFVISPEGSPSTPRPTLLGGYGGFAVSRQPGYQPSALAWVKAGGVWAYASLRGGGEEGESWHQSGMRAVKQNVFDDFHAAAEHLISDGWTTPEQLAIMGGSNGGLLMGAAITQRPELFRAVVCSAPLLDMVRYERFLLGRTWNDEYGTAEDPEELSWLLSYSPYHHVKESVDYPSVLFTVFESDTRVDPNHARKMCAALQHATGADPAKKPILIRRETEVGHGARSVSRSIDLLTDELSFLAHATGLPLTTLNPPPTTT